LSPLGLLIFYTAIYYRVKPNGNISKSMLCKFAKFIHICIYAYQLQKKTIL